MSEIDWNKPVQTRDGRKVRVLCTDRVGGLYPVIALVPDEITGEERVRSYTIHGTYSRQHSDSSNMDLVNVPIKGVFTGWVNVYIDTCSKPHRSKMDADFYRTIGCIACVPVTIKFKEGEGL